MLCGRDEQASASLRGEMREESICHVELGQSFQKAIKSNSRISLRQIHLPITIYTNITYSKLGSTLLCSEKLAMSDMTSHIMIKRCHHEQEIETQPTS